MTAVAHHRTKVLSPFVASPRREPYELRFMTAVVHHRTKVLSPNYERTVRITGVVRGDPDAYRLHGLRCLFRIYGLRVLRLRHWRLQQKRNLGGLCSGNINVRLLTGSPYLNLISKTEVFSNDKNIRPRLMKTVAYRRRATPSWTVRKAGQTWVAEELYLAIGTLAYWRTNMNQEAVNSAKKTKQKCQKYAILRLQRQ